jgi:hypothetical protein
MRTVRTEMKRETQVARLATQREREREREESSWHTSTWGKDKIEGRHKLSEEALRTVPGGKSNQIK